MTPRAVLIPHLKDLLSLLFKGRSLERQAVEALFLSAAEVADAFTQLEKFQLVGVEQHLKYGFY